MTRQYSPYSSLFLHLSHRLMRRINAVHFWSGTFISRTRKSKNLVLKAKDANIFHHLLQHALAWLYRLQPETRPGRIALIERCITKCNDTEMSYLTSLGIQTLAQVWTLMQLYCVCSFPGSILSWAIDLALQVASPRYRCHRQVLLHPAQGHRRL